MGGRGSRWLSLTQHEVGQIGVGPVALQAWRQVVEDAGGELHLMAPLLVAATVGEQGDATASQTVQTLCRQSAAARRGQPKEFRTGGSHDEGGLLAFHQADVLVGIACQQVLAVEALVERPVLWQLACTDQRYVRPPLIAAAMSVGMVLHDVAAVYLPLVVYLPEDDVAASGGSQQIVVVDAPDIIGRQMEALGHIGDQPIPESALWRMAAVDEGHGQRLEGRQRLRLAMVVRIGLGFGGPLVVAVVVRRLVVVAAGVLVVAFAHRVGHVLVAILGVDIAHQALPFAAVRTG